MMTPDKDSLEFVPAQKTPAYFLVGEEYKDDFIKFLDSKKIGKQRVAQMFTINHKKDYFEIELDDDFNSDGNALITEFASKK